MDYDEIKYFEYEYEDTDNLGGTNREFGGFNTINEGIKKKIKEKIVNDILELKNSNTITNIDLYLFFENETIKNKPNLQILDNDIVDNIVAKIIDDEDEFIGLLKIGAYVYLKRISQGVKTIRKTFTSNPKHVANDIVTFLTAQEKEKFTEGYLYLIVRNLDASQVPAKKIELKIIGANLNNLSSFEKIISSELDHQGETPSHTSPQHFLRADLFLYYNSDSATGKTLETEISEMKGEINTILAGLNSMHSKGGGRKTRKNKKSKNSRKNKKSKNSRNAKKSKNSRKNRKN